mgnify:CR=1 FL=1
MRKSLTYKVLAAVLALSAVNVFVPHNMLAYEIKSDNTTISPEETIKENIYGNGHSFTINGGTIKGDVYGVGNANYTGDVSGGNVTISGDATISGSLGTAYVYGGYTTNGNAEYNTVNISDNVTINGSFGTAYVYGGFSSKGNVEYNTVNISGSSFDGSVYGGSATGSTNSANNNIVNISGGTIGSDDWPAYVYGGYSDGGNAYDNEIIISGSADIAYANLYGGYKDTDTGNTLTIDGWKGNNGNGDYTVKSLNNFDSVNFDNLINLAQTTNFTVGSVYNVDAVNINSIGAGDYRSGTSKNIKLTLDNNKLDPNKITIIGDYDPNKYYTSERVNADGLFVNKYSQINVEKDANNTNTIKISATVEKSALAGTFINADGKVYKNSNGTPFDDSDNTTSLTIGNGFTANTDVVAGAYAAGSQTATGGIINISGTTNWEGTVFAGYSESGSVTNNIINVAAGTKQDISLNGGNQNASSNTLNIEGNGSTFNSIANFETINFNNIALNNDAALSLINANLNGTTLNVKSLAGGNNFKAGDTVTLIESESAIKGTADGITLANEIITAGVAQDLTVSAGQSGDNKIDLTITDVNLNSQTNLAAQTELHPKS